MALTRRDLLRAGRKMSGLRPPWAVAEEAFLDRCSRCGDCVGACPERILAVGDGGFPIIGFAHGACTFCGDCAAACKPGALARHDGRALPLLAVTGAGCLSLQGTACRVCGEWCGEGAITFRLIIGGRAEPRVDGERCSGCGACVGRCPASAITMHRHVGGQPREERAVCA